MPDAETRRACEAALRHLGRRAHGETELYNKLCERYPEECAAAAVAEMLEYGYLNDAEYAARKAEALHEKGKSRRDIRHRLLALGLGEAEVHAALEALAEPDEAVALRLVQKQYAEKLAAGRREQVMAALARRGFSHGDIIRAVRGAEAGEEEA